MSTSVCAKCGTPFEPAIQYLRFDGTLNFDGTWDFNGSICPKCHYELTMKKFAALMARQSLSQKESKAFRNLRLAIEALGVLVSLYTALNNTSHAHSNEIANVPTQNIIIINLNIDKEIDAFLQESGIDPKQIEENFKQFLIEKAEHENAGIDSIKAD